MDSLTEAPAMRPPRLTIRALTIAVAVLGALLWSYGEVGRRRHRFRTLSDRHLQRAFADIERANTPAVKGNERRLDLLRRRWIYHLDLCRKYNSASLRAFLPVL